MSNDRAADHGREKAELFTKYPISSLLIYNGATIFHYLLGGVGIVLGYNFTPMSWTFGLLYLMFSFLEMYVLMPLKVCPHCVYYRMRESLCVSGMNVFSKKIAKVGDIKDFPRRTQGLFCPNNLYMASFVIPALALIPALILNFSVSLLLILLLLVGLLLFRFFVIFPRIACLHCYAKFKCPQAGSMGVREL